MSHTYSLFPGLPASRSDRDAELDHLLDQRGSYSGQSQSGSHHCTYHAHSSHSGRVQISIHLSINQLLINTIYYLSRLTSDLIEYQPTRHIRFSTSLYHILRYNSLKRTARTKTVIWCTDFVPSL